MGFFRWTDRPISMERPASVHLISMFKFREFRPLSWIPSSPVFFIGRNCHIKASKPLKEGLQCATFFFFLSVKIALKSGLNIFGNLNTSFKTNTILNFFQLYCKLADFLTDNVARVTQLTEGRDNKRAFILDVLLPEVRNDLIRLAYNINLLYLYRVFDLVSEKSFKLDQLKPQTLWYME